jgi:hypothetical protein
MMGELTYFLGFQIKQLKDGTFISQTKYTTDMLKKFDMDKPSPLRPQCLQLDIPTLMETARP